MRIVKYSAICLLAILLLPSCGGCQRQKPAADANSGNDSILAIDIPLCYFDDNWNTLDNKDILSKADYDSLKLGSLSFIGSYGDLQYEMGKRLIDQKDRKLLTVKAIASGEIAEYLLGYIQNNITDSILVAYEDNVEYYSKTSSVISGDTITVATINHDYSGMEETSDTIVTRYIITPQLRFEEIIEEE